MKPNMPPVRPATALPERWQYETGQTKAKAVVGLAGKIIAAADAFEPAGVAEVLETSGWLTTLDVVIATTGLQSAYYLLLFDVAGPNAVALATNNNGLGAARYSYGPISPGGLMIREGQELWRSQPYCGAEEPMIGIPFDNGVLAVLSTTPRVATYQNEAVASIVARGHL